MTWVKSTHHFSFHKKLRGSVCPAYPPRCSDGNRQLALTSPHPDPAPTTEVGCVFKSHFSTHRNCFYISRSKSRARVLYVKIRRSFAYSVSWWWLMLSNFLLTPVLFFILLFSILLLALRKNCADLRASCRPRREPGGLVRNRHTFIAERGAVLG